MQLASGSSTLRRAALAHLTSETLTRVNALGVAEPVLAASWSSDKTGRRWRFRIRTGVVTHDGSPLTPTLAASALEAALASSGMEVIASSEDLTITTASAKPDLTVILADPAFAIAGTGAFKPDGENALAAFENHWAGRPFVDRVELLPPRSGAAAIDSAEVWEVPIGPGKRVIEGFNLWSTVPVELLALELTPPNPTLAAALSASIDRESIATALTQRLGEPAGSLLPQWLTGYSFLFPAVRDLARARTLFTTAQTSPTVLSYEPSDPLARIVADRIALNGRDAGINIQSRAGAPAPVRIVRRSVNPNAVLALDELGRRPESSDPEALYAAERGLLGEGRFVPIMHLPLVFAFSQRVQLPPSRTHTLPRLPLADVWLSQ